MQISLILITVGLAYTCITTLLADARHLPDGRRRSSIGVLGQYVGKVLAAGYFPAVIYALYMMVTHHLPIT